MNSRQSALPSHRQNPFLLADVAPAPARTRRSLATMLPRRAETTRHWWRLALPLLCLLVLESPLIIPAWREPLSGWLALTAEEFALPGHPPLPVRYHAITSAYGPRWGRMHEGVDLAAAEGTPIHAASAGTVHHSGWEGGYGRSVVIEHDNGTWTRYAHCAKTLVKPGQRVTKGETIAEVGSTGHSTGPHLHFEVLVDGKRRNPAWYYPLEQSTPQPKTQTAPRHWIASIEKEIRTSVNGSIQGLLGENRR